MFPSSTLSYRLEYENQMRDVFSKKISSYEHLYSVNPSEDGKRLLLEARTKPESLYDFKLKGIMVRSRARWVEDGEKTQSIF